MCMWSRQVILLFFSGAHTDDIILSRPVNTLKYQSGITLKGRSFMTTRPCIHILGHNGECFPNTCLM